MWILNINTFGDIPDVQLQEIRQATELDNNRQEAIHLVKKGWPEDKRLILPFALPYFVIRDSVAIVDGILLKREAVVIPLKLLTSTKKKLLKYSFPGKK